MKKFIYLLVMAVLAGCVQAPHRSGSIVIHKFDIEGFKTSNPVDVNARVVADVRDALHKQILGFTKKNSSMLVTESCSPGGYELKGKIIEVSTDTDHKYRLVYVARQTKFKVEIEAFFYRCGNDAYIVDITEDENEEDMIEVVEDLANSIVNKIRRDPTIPPTVSSQ